MSVTTRRQTTKRQINCRPWVATRIGLQQALAALTIFFITLTILFGVVSQSGAVEPNVSAEESTLAAVPVIYITPDTSNHSLELPSLSSDRQWLFWTGTGVLLGLAALASIWIADRSALALTLCFIVAACLQSPDMSGFLLGKLLAAEWSPTIFLFTQLFTIALLAVLIYHTANRQQHARIWLVALPGVGMLSGGLILFILPPHIGNPLILSITLCIIATCLVMSCKWFIQRPEQPAAFAICCIKLVALIICYWLLLQYQQQLISNEEFNLILASTVWIETTLVTLCLIRTFRHTQRHNGWHPVSPNQQADITDIGSLLKIGRHDLRSPLSDIIGLASLIADHPLDHNQQNNLLKVQRTARAALKTIDDIFAGSQNHAISDTDKTGTQAEPFNLTSLIKECTQHYVRHISDNNVELVINLSENLPDLLTGEHEKIRQIIMSLLEYLLITQQCAEIYVNIDLSSDDQLQIDFSNTWPADTQANEHFFGAISQTRALADQCNTQLKLAKDHSKITAVISVQPFIYEQDFSSTMAMLNGRRALVVDDNPTSCEVICSYLQRWGVETLQAHTATDAIALVTHQEMIGKPLNLAIFDYVMPDKNGLELIREIIDDNNVQRPFAIILMSNATWDIEPELTRNYGIHHILAKPVLAETLRLTLLEEFHLRKSFSDGLALDTAASQAHDDNHTNARFLLVEDNSISAAIVSSRIRSLGFYCDIATDGKQALEHFASQYYDIVLLDCELPDQSGFDVARKMKRQLVEQPGSSRQIKIIALTADSSEAYRNMSIEAGMDDHYVKPISKSVLETLIQDTEV